MPVSLRQFCTNQSYVFTFSYSTVITLIIHFFHSRPETNVFYKAFPSWTPTRINHCHWPINTRKHFEHHISKPNEANCKKCLSHMYLCSYIWWLYFGVKKSKVVSHSRQWPENIYLTSPLREFNRILVTDIFGFIDVLIRFWRQKATDEGYTSQ